MRFIKLIAAASATLALGLGAPMASAAPITVDLEYTGNLGPGTPTTRISGTGRSAITVYAGEFEMEKVSDPSDHFYYSDTINAFCIQITEILRPKGQIGTYVVETGLGSFSDVAVQNKIDALFTNYYMDAQESAEKNAAFQIALWSIIDANFQYSHVASGIAAQVEAYLADLAGKATGGYEFYVLSIDGYQDLITARAVPEPAMLALLGGGLIGVALLRRRRAS
ncbi:MAG: PEP-CTERM sorting domain-containing protein [Gammaproteobacteria bacterium]|nr:MAG: PEP-CTERM sorting domain-containing protein [Gammaproteobacteria bacterium]